MDLMDERLEILYDVAETLPKVNAERISLVFHKFGKGVIFTVMFFKVLYYIYKISQFEKELARYSALGHATTGFVDKHEVLCEFNDILSDYKQLLISYYDLTTIEDETGESIFNIYTYGGKI